MTVSIEVRQSDIEIGKLKIVNNASGVLVAPPTLTLQRHFKTLLSCVWVDYSSKIVGWKDQNERIVCTMNYDDVVIINNVVKPTTFEVITL